MKKSLVLSVMLAAFAWSATSYGVPLTRTLVYKGTIKASKSIFDVADTNNLLSGTIKGYWAVRVVDEGEYEGYVVDSNAVLYDTRQKYYKVIPGGMEADPCDPCHIVLMSFQALGTDGSLTLNLVGKGKPTKFSNDTGVARDFVPTTLKGTGLFLNYDIFDPAYVLSGPITASMTLDSARTKAANPYVYTVHEIVNDIAAEFADKAYTNWPNFAP